MSSAKARAQGSARLSVQIGGTAEPLLYPNTMLGSLDENMLGFITFQYTLSVLLRAQFLLLLFRLFVWGWVLGSPWLA